MTIFLNGKRENDFPSTEDASSLGHGVGTESCQDAAQRRTPFQLTPDSDWSHLLIVSDAHCVLVSSAQNRRVERTQMTHIVEKREVALVFRSLDLICLFFVVFQ